MFGPHKRNLRGQNNNFWGTSDLEFERTNKDFGGTKQGFWGGQKSVLKLKSLPNFHILLNLGLQKYNITLWAPLLKIQLHPLVPPNSFGPPTMVAVVADFKDRG